MWIRPAARDFTNPQFATPQGHVALTSARHPQALPSQRNKCPSSVFLLSLSSTLHAQRPPSPLRCGASAARLEQVKQPKPPPLCLD